MDTDEIIIYTDGSCHTQLKAGAWASILFIGKKKIVLTGEETDTTHNRMELLAVIKAIDYLAQNNYNEPVTIYADSQYACEIPRRKEKLKAKGFLTNKGTPIQNTDLVQILISQIENYNIQFIKVKAHSKTNDTASINNSEVDQLVRDMVRKKKWQHNKTSKYFIISIDKLLYIGNKSLSLQSP